MRNKPVKIVITNDCSWLNRGNAALLNSRIRDLKRLIPDAEFTVFSFQPEVEKKGLKIPFCTSSFMPTPVS